ncbi:hypothetical protein [Thermomonospora cellulosilytica]|uniref:Uncharacterized protein n=1 Tax=Thermomonospora cellulosilytica TaxID=1411118 RepID=A0A7W3MUB5_9ACTN|nr:hypothetical protein [Thermomonospora cellulosilytica]MBA9002004.1 hypothetical protein [Thermomonospora cellulosilytica]
MTYVRARDWPPTVQAADYTDQLNLTSSSYVPGSPEVGVQFVAPTSGRIIITIGGGARDNTNDNRVFLSPQIFEGPDVSGTEILAPSVTIHGWGQTSTAATAGYGSRESLYPFPGAGETELVPGQVYYARVMMAAEQGVGASADVFSRFIIVEPAP